MLCRLIVIPFSFLRRLDSLKYTSVIALTAIGYLIILVLAHFAKGDTIPYRGHVKVAEWAGADHFLASLPVIVFAYTCHQNVSSLTVFWVGKIFRKLTKLARCFLS